jgi:hypothetical protein
MLYIYLVYATWFSLRIDSECYIRPNLQRNVSHLLWRAKQKNFIAELWESLCSL